MSIKRARKSSNCLAACNLVDDMLTRNIPSAANDLANPEIRPDVAFLSGQGVLGFERVHQILFDVPKQVGYPKSFDCPRTWERVHFTINKYSMDIEMVILHHKGATKSDRSARMYLCRVHDLASLDALRNLVENQKNSKVYFTNADSTESMLTLPQARHAMYLHCLGTSVHAGYTTHKMLLGVPYPERTIKTLPQSSKHTMLKGAPFSTNGAAEMVEDPIAQTLRELEEEEDAYQRGELEEILGASYPISPLLLQFTKNQFVCEPKIRVMNEWTETNEWAGSLVLNQHARSIGLDAEWTAYTAGVDCLQFCVLEEARANVVLLHLGKIGRESPSIPPHLLTLLQSSEKLFFGNNIQGDLTRLGNKYQCDLGHAQKKSPSVNIFDCSKAANKIHPSEFSKKTSKLDKLCKHFLNLDVEKGVTTPRVGEWGNYPWTFEQIKYAALDAVVSLQLGLVLQKAVNKEDLNQTN